MKNLILVTLTIAVMISCAAKAGGIETKPMTGSKTIALNGLYFAGSDGIAKSLSNPAGLVYHSFTGIEITVLDRLAQSEFDNQARGIFKSLREDDFSFNAGILWSISENFKSAISYQQALDYDISWPYAVYYQQDSLNALFVFQFYNQISVETFSLSLAYKTGDFSLGISPIAYRVVQKTAFPQNNPLWTSGVGTAAYQFSYNMDAWAFGFVLGVIADITPELKAAVNIKAGYSASLEGDATSRMFSVTDSAAGTTKAESEFEMPWVLGLGVLYNLNPALKINFDAQYSLWQGLEGDTKFKFGDKIWQDKLVEIDAGSGINGGRFVREYNNTLDIGIGLEYTSNGDISYRAGYLFSQTPNSDRTFTMLSPVVDRHVFSIGAGLREGNLVVDASLLYSLGVKRKVENKDVPSLDGSYNYNLIAPMITLRYNLF